MQDFNFYKVNETLNHKYYQIPQELFINPLYKNTLNSDSKLLYGFLLLLFNMQKIPFRLYISHKGSHVT